MNRKGIPEGIFTIMLEVTDDMGLEDTYRATIEVEETSLRAHCLYPAPQQDQ